MKVPFVDLHAQYLTIKSEIDAAIAEVIANLRSFEGSHVDKFEHAWARNDRCQSTAFPAPMAPMHFTSRCGL